MIDLLERHRDALFGQEHAHAPRIGRPAAVIELHAALLHASRWMQAFLACGYSAAGLTRPCGFPGGQGTTSQKSLTINISRPLRLPLRFIGHLGAVLVAFQYLATMTVTASEDRAITSVADKAEAAHRRVTATEGARGARSPHLDHRHPSGLRLRTAAPVRAEPHLCLGRHPAAGRDGRLPVGAVDRAGRGEPMDRFRSWASMARSSGNAASSSPERRAA